MNDTILHPGPYHKVIAVCMEKDPAGSRSDISCGSLTAASTYLPKYPSSRLAPAEKIGRGERFPHLFEAVSVGVPYQ